MDGIFGIDLGSVCSAISYVGYSGEPTVVRGSDGDEATPSVVYFENPGSVVVGKTAKEAAGFQPDTVVSLVKREMGNKDCSRVFHGRTYSPSAISAIIVAALARDAANQTRRPVRQAVITVPGLFGALEKDATRKAGEIAGLEVIGILPEPVAAALAYEAAGLAGGSTFLVYDLGGGIFDVALITMTGDGVEVIAVDGDHNLGGADWDARLLAYLKDQIIEQCGDDSIEDDEVVLQELLLLAEDTKKALSIAAVKKVIYRVAGSTASVTVTRGQFEEMTADLLSQTIRITSRMLLDAEVRFTGIRDQIDGLLLVGGSSKMPAVAERLRSELGLEPTLFDPDFAVAKGAALYAASVRPRAGQVTRRAGKTIVNVLPRAVGIKLVDTSKPDWLSLSRDVFYIEHLIPAQTRLPHQPEKFTAGTAIDSQEAIAIEIWEQRGSLADPSLTANRRVDNGGLIEGLGPLRLPAGSPIDVTLSADAEGAVRLLAREPVSGRELPMSLQVTVMSGAEVAEAQASLRQLGMSIQAMQFDENAYREFLNAHSRKKTDPVDLLERYAMTLSPVPTDAQVTAQLSAVRAYWNRTAFGSTRIARMAKWCLMRDAELRAQHGDELKTVAWWQASARADAAKSHAAILELAANLRLAYGELGVVTAADLAREGARKKLTPAQAVEAARQAGLAVIDARVALPEAPLPATVLQALARQMNECQVAAIPELLHPGSGPFRIVARYESVGNPVLRLDMSAIHERATEASKAISPVSSAMLGALQTLADAVQNGVDLRDVTIFLLTDLAADAPPVIAREELKRAGVEEADAAVIAALLAGRRGAPRVSDAGERQSRLPSAIAEGSPPSRPAVLPAVPLPAGNNADTDTANDSDFNFDLLFSRADGRYQVLVTRSPAGTGQSASFDLPFSDIELENLAFRVGSLRARTRRIEHPLVSYAKEAGGRLFNAVFSGAVEECLRRSLGQAGQKETPLRIRLQMSTCPELSNMPWEFLYDRSEDWFLALSGRTPVIRYMQLPIAQRKIVTNAPLRILVIKSDPDDDESLDLEAEWDLVSEALGSLTSRGLVSFTELSTPTLSELRRTLLRDNFHILHYMGHGKFDARAGGTLLFADQTGLSQPITAEDLGVMLYDHQSIRLVVLNACEAARTDATDPFAGVAESLVRRGIPAVVAMQFEVTDRAAIEFAPALYGALARGLPIDTAVAEARKAIRAISALEWATPVLYLRADETQLFEVHGGGEPPEAPVAVAPATATGVVAPVRAPAQLPEAETAEAPIAPSSIGRRQRWRRDATPAKPEATEISLRIGIAGTSGSGKTVLMRILIKHFREAVAERFGADIRFATVTPGGYLGQLQYQAEVENPLYVDGILPGVTPPLQSRQSSEQSESTAVVLRWRQEISRPLRTPVTRSTLLSLGDTPGYDLANLDSVFGLKYLANINALIITVDPFAIRGARSAARTPESAVRDAPDAETVDVISRITEFFRTELDVGGDGRIPLPVAVVVTKIDAFYTELDRRSPIVAVPRDVAAYDDRDGRAVHEKVRELLGHWGASDIDTHMRLNYSDYRYFAVSALGAVPDYEGGRIAAAEIIPHRIEDPVLWLMSKNKAVDTV